MRVVHIIDDATAIGGVRTYLEQLLPALRGRGIDGSVVAGVGPAEFAGAHVAVVPGIEADGASLRSAVVAGLERAVGDASADVVFLHTARSPDVARVASRCAPVVAYAHDFAMRCPGGGRYLHRSARVCDEGPGLRCFWRAYTERTTNRRPDRLYRAYRRADVWPDVWPALRRIVVASSFVRDVLVGDGFDVDRIRVVPYPIAAAAAPAGQPDRDVLYLGRLTAAKGVDVLIDAAAALDGVTVAIAGDGPARRALEEQATEAGLSGRVEFLGWVDEAQRPALLGSARVLALPSLWPEPFGMVGLEAFAAGVPVVASRVGGIPTWLRDGEAGLLVSPGQPRDLAAALGRVLRDDELRRRLAACGPAEAARFSMRRHLELLLSALVP